MNGNIGMRALSALFAVLLVSVGVVPAMATGELQDSKSETHRSISPDYLKDAKPATPLEESEMISIVVPYKLTLTKDARQDANIVNISFSVSEFDEQFTCMADHPGYHIFKGINENEEVAVLRMPKTMFGYLNQNPTTININFPTEYFTVYPNVGEMEKSIGGGIARSIQAGDPLSYEISRGDWDLYAEWIQFNHKIPRQITYLTGKITPYYYSNSEYGYCAYHEREIYLNEGDTIELVVAYHDQTDGGKVLLFPAIWDDPAPDPIYPLPFIEVSRSSLPHEYEYYCGIGVGNNVGTYELWFHDASTDNWWYYRYDDDTSPSTYIDHLDGSSELWLDPVASGYFFMGQTIPVKDEWSWEGGIWYKPRAAFEYNNGPTPDDYVHIDYYWGGELNQELFTRSYCDSRW
ncbi:hypothetical protein [Methanoculleus sp.]|uniref:hypothetical protein n=1 Tax=Methanoculleus sp. TaxID=90427 RepID=UPI002FCA9E3D